MSQVIHPSVLTNQAVLRILAFQETITHRGPPFASETKPRFPAALFEQKLTLGKISSDDQIQGMLSTGPNETGT